MSTRILYLNKNINNENLQEIMTNILKFISEDDVNDNKFKNYKREPIHLHIQSFGGSVYDMFALIDIITTSKTPIYTYCLYAMSAASLIFLAGHKRFIYNNSTIMIHQISCTNSNKYLDFKIHNKQLTHLQNRINKFILDRSDIPKDKYYDKFNRRIDWYLSAKKALKYRIATDIIKNKT